MNIPFSCTKAVAKLARQECTSCSFIEVLKCQACRQECIGSDHNEQMLAAAKAKEEIGTDFDQLVKTKFLMPHESLDDHLEVLKLEVITYGEAVNELSSLPEPAGASLDQDLARIKARLDAGETELNLQAVELFEAAGWQ